MKQQPPRIIKSVDKEAAARDKIQAADEFARIEARFLSARGQEDSVWKCIFAEIRALRLEIAELKSAKG